MNRRSILAAYKKKSSHFETGVTGFKSGNLFKKDTLQCICLFTENHCAYFLIIVAALVPLL